MVNFRAHKNQSFTRLMLLSSAFVLSSMAVQAFESPESVQALNDDQALNSAQNPESVETLDLMVVYSNTAKNHPNGRDMAARVAASVAYTNRAFANSGANVRFRLVKLQNVQNYDGKLRSNDLNRLMNDAQVIRWRNQSGADFVTLYGDSTEWCGVGYVPQGDPNTGRFYSNASGYAFNISSIGCGHATFAHELGHNMSLGHSNRQNSSGGVWRWARGHGISNVFVSIMGYTSAFSTRNRIQVFSNPNVTSCAGYACGVPIGQANEAFSTESLNRLASQLAQFRASQSTPSMEFSYLSTGDFCIGVEPNTMTLVPQVCSLNEGLMWRFNERQQLVNKAQPRLCADPGQPVRDFASMQLTSCSLGPHQQWTMQGNAISNRENPSRLLSYHPDYRELVVTGQNATAEQDWVFSKVPPSTPSSTIEYSFETGLEGWVATYNGSIKVDKARASQGKQSARVFQRPYNYSGLELDIRKLLIPNQTYQLSVDVNVGSQSNETIDIRLLTKDRDGWRWHDVLKQQVSGNQWQRLSASVTYKVDAGSVEHAVLMIFGPQNSVNFNVDRVIFSK